MAQFPEHNSKVKVGRDWREVHAKLAESLAERSVSKDCSHLDVLSGPRVRRQ
jgi:hypothetical protein